MHHHKITAIKYGLKIILMKDQLMAYHLFKQMIFCSSKVLLQYVTSVV